MVEGAIPKRNDRPHYSLSIFQNIRSSKTHHPISIVLHEGIPTGIMLRAIAPVMRLTVNFQNQPQTTAVKIGYVGPDRMLTAELEAGLTTAQMLPEQHFRQAHGTAKFAGSISYGATRLRHAPSTTPLRGAVPLPLQGRIHAAHPLVFIQASHDPFARSRTRAM